MKNKSFIELLSEKKINIIGIKSIPDQKAALIQMIVAVNAENSIEDYGVFMRDLTLYQLDSLGSII